MDDLERVIDRSLKALPTPAAPQTLMPRVMAAVALADRRPWYSRAWLTWPAAAQVASVLALALVGVAAWLVVPAAWSWAGGLLAAGAPVAAPVSTALGWAGTGLAIGRAIWLFVQPLVLYFALIAVISSLVMAAYWAALNRLALGGASLQ